MATTKASPTWGGPVLAIVLALVLFLAINLFGVLRLSNLQWDFTERGLYTLSPGTQAALAGIDEPVTLRLYRTRQLLDAVPVLQTHAMQVDQLLATMVEASGGKVRLETVETLPFSAEEDRALGFGLAGFPLNRSGEQGFYGLVGTNSLDGLEVLPFLDPARQGLLQYDLTRFIYRLSQPTEMEVAVVDGLSMYGSMQAGRRPWAVLDLLGRDYRLQQVAADADAIPASTDVLLVTHPANLAPGLLFAIDQYVLGGGAALVFLDPLAEYSPPDPQNPNRPLNPSSALPELMAAWGLSLDTTQVVGDRDMAMETVGVAGQQRVVADYLPWLRVDGAALNRSEPMTARIEAMRLSSAGALTVLDDAATTLTPLIESSPNAMLLAQADVMRRPNPNSLLNQFAATGERYVMAGRVTGHAATAFPEGRPQSADAQPSLPGAPEPLAEGDINVIVVADSDMLADSHMVDNQGRVTTSNADFVLNAIGELAGGDALIAVRGGGEISRPFTLVADMQDRAEATYRATEEQLVTELADVQQKLLQMQGPSESATTSGIALSREQQATIAEYNQRIAEIRAELREVRRALRAEIDALGTTLQLANMALVPGLLILIGIGLAIWRGIRIRRHLKPRGGTSEVRP